jgi:hypothetical protein
VKVLMFQRRFAAAVINGAKCQTIRPPRKRPIVAGDSLSLRQWSGTAYRSPQSALRSATCVGTDQVEVKPTCLIIAGRRFMAGSAAAEAFASADGFYSYADMVQWFDRAHGLPFKGILIRWRP